MSTPFVPNITRLKKHRRRNSKGKEDITKLKLVKYKYGLQSITEGRMFSKHLEMCRKTISNYYNRKTNIYMRCYPYLSYTTKPHDVRRGRGKGTIDGWYHHIRENKIILEFESNNIELAFNIARIVRSKLPIKIRLITQEILDNEKTQYLNKNKENHEI